MVAGRYNLFYSNAYPLTEDGSEALFKLCRSNCMIISDCAQAHNGRMVASLLHDYYSRSCSISSHYLLKAWNSTIGVLNLWEGPRLVTRPRLIAKAD